MARPKKEPDIAKLRSFTMRLPITQYEVWCEDAKTAGLSVSDYVRKSMSNHGFIYKFNIVRDDEKLNEIIVQLSRIGNNLNQMMRYFHQGGLLTPEIKKDLHDGTCEIYRLSEYFDNMESDQSYGDLETYSE